MLLIFLSFNPFKGKLKLNNTDIHNCQKCANAQGC